MISEAGITEGETKMAFSRLIPRFGLKSLLVAVAIVSLGAKVVADFRHVSVRRAEYEQEYDAYSAGVTPVDDICHASLRLLEAESHLTPPWRDVPRAIREHIDRMHAILDQQENACFPKSDPQTADLNTCLGRVRVFYREAKALENEPISSDGWQRLLEKAQKP